MNVSRQNAGGVQFNCTNFMPCFMGVGRAIFVILLAGSPVFGSCVGDCSQNETVTVDELVQGVDVAFGNAELHRCPQFDSDRSLAIEVHELVAGISNALHGCPVLNLHTLLSENLLTDPAAASARFRLEFPALCFTRLRFRR